MLDIVAIAQTGGREPVRTSGVEFLIRCPWPERHRNQDEHPSCRLNPTKNTYYCDVCQEGGGARDLARLLGVSAGDSSTRTPSRLSFCAGAPIPAATQGVFRTQYGKGYRPETWAAFSVTEGIVAPEASPSRGEPAIAFPLPSGGYHVYRSRQAARNNRWRFASGGKPDLIVAGLDREGPVVLAEGEWDAMQAYEAGFAVATSTGGAGTFKPQWAAQLAGRQVVLVYDADPPGQRGAVKALRTLRSAAIDARNLLLPLPGTKEAKDLSDYVALHGVEELRTLVDHSALPGADAPEGAIEEALPDGRDHGAAATGTDGGGSTRKSQATTLVTLVLASGAELFHDPVGEGWLRIPVRAHREIWPLRSKGSRRWLARLFWSEEGKAVGENGINAALAVLDARARFDGPEHELHNRVAWHQGAIWYDLCDARWRAIQVTEAGWVVIDQPPILFRRHAHQRSQVEPIAGRPLRSLLRFVNIADERSCLLLLVYLVSALVPGIPHPIPVLHGPQGAAKTSLFRLLRRLIDPSATETLTLPRDIHELVQQLDHHWFPLYDNLGLLPDWASDALCRAVTGEGFSKRQLYTDSEDVILSFRRCVGLNGINVAAHKADLLDRCILVGLDAIPPERRRPEGSFWREFGAVQPELFGAALTVLAGAMGRHSQVSLESHPRMADFATWGVAIAQALGSSQQEFLDAYAANADRRNLEVIAGNPVAAAVAALMDGRQEWSGTPSELLSLLDIVADSQHIDRRSKAWPKGPQALSRRLNEIVPNLVAAGIQVARRRDRDRTVSLLHYSGNTVGSVDTVETPGDQGLHSDGIDNGTPDSVAVPSPHDSVAGGTCCGTDAIDGIPEMSPLGPQLAPVEHVEYAPSQKRCRSCRGTTYWTHQDGRQICARCHPPTDRPNPADHADDPARGRPQ